MSQPVDWRAALQEWLKNNPKTMPDDLAELHQEFLRRFPRATLGEMTLEQYALGHNDSKNSFCYWLEWETGMLGSVRGGSSAKWGVWWSSEEGDWRYNRSFKSAQIAINKLKQGMLALLEAVESDEFHRLDSIGDKKLGQNRNSLRAKPLYLYYPDEFLPINNPTHLANMLRAFGQEPERGLHARNRQLLAYLQTLPEFDGFATLQMMRFLYTYNFQNKAVIFTNQQALQTAIQGFVRFANSARYNLDEHKYKNELLQAFNDAIPIILNEDAEQAREVLESWLKTYRNSINNLTSWQTTDNFSKYLQNVPATQIQQNMVALLDEDGDVGERIDAFREAVETDFQTYLQQKNTVHLGLISLFLMGSDRNTHIIYRSSIIYKACEDWGAPQITSGTKNDGTKYSQYLTLIPPLQSQLTKALDRSVDLIDVHSLLWFNHSDEYEEFKQAPDKKAAVVEERPFMRHLIQVTKRTRNIILYGPPGTGKTYWARQFGLRFEPQHVRFVTFHQSFAYEDFVEGLKPYAQDGKVLYKVIPGVFRSICEDAAKDPEHDYLLVIDEINRANIAKVFGELITLLEDDKRQGNENELSTQLPYSQEAFSIPANLYLFGTMNTADRSIALLDIALRRRFTFIEVAPKPDTLGNTKVDGLSLGDLLAEINGRIALLLDSDHQIGHSYFWGIDNLADLRFAWEHRIVPLLQEYFYNDGERLQAVLGKQFVVATRPDQAKQQALANWIDPETASYQVKKLSDEAFMQALKQLVSQNGDN